MAGDNRLDDALEDLLEALYVMIQDRGRTSGSDLDSGIWPSSADIPLSVTLEDLDRRGLIAIAADGAVTLTPEGEARASAVLHRHQTLRDFFIEVLGVAADAADNGACRIEHVVSDEIIESMIHYTRAVRKAGQTASDSPQAGKHGSASIRGHHNARTPVSSDRP